MAFKRSAPSRPVPSTGKLPSPGCSCRECGLRLDAAGKSLSRADKGFYCPACAKRLSADGVKIDPAQVLQPLR